MGSWHVSMPSSEKNPPGWGRQKHVASHSYWWDAGNAEKFERLLFAEMDALRFGVSHQSRLVDMNEYVD